MKLMNIKQLRKNSVQAANFLKTAANAERLIILCNLTEGEQSVGDLWNKSDLSQSAFSQHLAVLREHNLVKTRKDMQTVFYSLNDDKIIDLLRFLQRNFC